MFWGENNLSSWHCPHTREEARTVHAESPLTHYCHRCVYELKNNTWSSHVWRFSAFQSNGLCPWVIWLIKILFTYLKIYTNSCIELYGKYVIEIASVLITITSTMSCFVSVNEYFNSLHHNWNFQVYIKWTHSFCMNCSLLNLVTECSTQKHEILGLGRRLDTKLFFNKCLRCLCNHEDHVTGVKCPMFVVSVSLKITWVMQNFPPFFVTKSRRSRDSSKIVIVHN